MSYPYDTPALSMDNVWNSGSYTPEDVVAYIRDSYTPVNKTSMRNSLGYQVSLVQNFVNTNYLGRRNNPVNTGYIQYLKSSGNLYIEDGDYSNTIDSDGLDLNYASVSYLYLRPNSIQAINNTYDSIYIYPTGIVIENSVMTSYTTSDLSNSHLNFSTQTDAVSISHDGAGTLDLSGTYVDIFADAVNCSSIYITPTRTSQQIERIECKNGSVTLSKTEPTTIDTGINTAIPGVTLLYFGIRRVSGGTQQVKDNWLPANYGTNVSGYWMMTSSNTVFGFSLSDMVYSAHLLESSTESKWYIVVSPVSTTFENYYGLASLEYRYSILTSSFDVS